MRGLLLVLAVIAGCGGAEVAPGGCAQGVRRCADIGTGKAGVVQECRNGAWELIDDCAARPTYSCTTAVTGTAHCEKN